MSFGDGHCIWPFKFLTVLVPKRLHDDRLAPEMAMRWLQKRKNSPDSKVFVKVKKISSNFKKLSLVG